jgi:hypothetical protein
MIQEALEESKSVRESTIKDPRNKNPNAPLNRPTTPTMLTKLLRKRNHQINNSIEQQQEPQKDLPPELQSRPKILRTPVNVDKDQFHRMLQMQYQQMAEAQRNSPEKMHPYPEEQGIINRSSINDITNNSQNVSHIVSVNENRQSFNDLNVNQPASNQKPIDKDKVIKLEINLIL